MLISIITINFNDCKGLEMTVNSVSQQNYKGFEHIIIDGGSTDGSKKFIEENRDKFSYWVSEKDNGIYHAMNKGIVAAKAEYLLFLNSGDFLFKTNVLETAASYLIDGDILYGDIMMFNENDETLKRGLNPNELTVYSFFKGTINHPAAFIKKDLFKQFGLYDETLSIVSDWKFFLEVAGIARVKVKYIDCVISYFDINGISSTNEKIIEFERKKVLTEIIPKGFLEDYKKFERLNKTQNLKLVRLAIKIESNMQFKKIKNCFKKLFN